MRCNINSKGKVIRLVSGVVFVLVGLVAALLGAYGIVPGRWAWASAAALVAVGGFQVWEGWCGWCVLRAMGFKTPL